MSRGSSARRPESERPAVTLKHWGDAILRWPFEHVPVELEVVTIRELTTLEWVLERILDEFPGTPPSLAEAAEELGLAEAFFLRDTLEQLLELQAIERRAPAESPQDDEQDGADDADDADDVEAGLDLSDVQLTETGRDLFRLGKIEGAPDHPRIELVFDVLTGAHVPVRPKDANDDALDRLKACPLLDDEEWPEPTADLALDRVRTCSQERGERYQQGESRIRRAEVIASDTYHFEAPVRAALSIDPKGRVVIGGDVTPEQLAWLEDHAAAVVEAASLQGMLSTRADDEFPLVDERWLATVDGLASQADLAKAVAELLAGAKREVLVHGRWQLRFDVQEALRQLANRGVHSVRQATVASLDYWKDRDSLAPGFCLSLGGGEIDDIPVAIVVDAERAIVLERISVVLPNNVREAVVVGARVGRDRARVVWSALKEGFSEAIADWADQQGDEQGLLVASFLGASPRLTQELAEATAAQEDALAAVVRLKRFATWFSGRPDCTRFEWTAAASETLDAYLDRLTEFPREQVGRIVEVAEGLMPAERLWERLLEHVQMRSALVDPAPLESITTVAAAVRSRPSFGPGLPPSVFRQFIDPCLELPHEARLASPELVERIVRLAGEERARRWTSRYSSLWGQPADAATLESWLRAHAPVRHLLSTDFSRFATSFLQRAVGASRGGMDESLRTAIIDAWKQCRLPPGEVEGLLRKAAPTTSAPNGSAPSAGSKKKNKGKNKGGKR